MWGDPIPPPPELARQRDTVKVNTVTEIINNPTVTALLNQIELLVPEWKRRGLPSVRHLLPPQGKKTWGDQRGRPSARPAGPKAAAAAAASSSGLPPPGGSPVDSSLGGRGLPLIPRHGLARRAWEANLKAAEMQDSWDRYPCGVCHQWEHETSLCPTPICWICEGKHWGFECSARVVCSVCLIDTDEVCSPVSRHHENYCPKSRCKVCNEPGHHARQRGVPQWEAIQCWNCGDKGHYSYDCKKPIKCHKCFEEGHRGDSCPVIPRAGGLRRRCHPDTEQNPNANPDPEQNLNAKRQKCSVFLSARPTSAEIAD